MNDSMRKITYYENVLEFKESTNSMLQRSDVNNWLLCRCCCSLAALSDEFDKVRIIGMNGALLSVQKLLHMTTGQMIDDIDRLPQKICRECLNKLTTLYYFQQQTKRAEIILQRLLTKLDEAEGRQASSSEDANPVNAADAPTEVCTTTVADADCSSANADADGEGLPDALPPLEKQLVDADGGVEIDDEAAAICADEVGFVALEEKDLPYVEEPSEALHMIDNNAAEEEHELLEDFTEEEFFVELEDESNDGALVLPLPSANKNTNESDAVHDQDTIESAAMETDEEWPLEQQADDSTVPRKRRRLNILRSKEICLECNICHQAFRKQCELIHHCSKKHPNEKAYKCNECGGAFTHIQSLSRHRLTHTPELRDHVCTTCDKAFVRSDDLRRHVRIHTGQRPYGCTTCDKAFKQISELKEHKLTHIKEKLFVCLVCGHRLTSRNGLYLHKKVHEGVKKYACSFCADEGMERRFLTNKELRSHMNVHMKRLHKEGGAP